MRFLLAIAFGLATTVSALAQQAPDSIPAKCLWGIYVEMQLAREHCDLAPGAVDAAIDDAIPAIEAKLIDAGEITRQQADQHREMVERQWGPDGERLAQKADACQSVNPAIWGMTATQVQMTTAAIQAATPDMFSEECL